MMTRTRGLFALLFFGIVSFTAASATAEKVHLPRVGQQYLSVGLTLQPGFLYDETTPDARNWSSVAATGAGTTRFGFHQIVSETFLMSAEADLGVQWMNEHTAQTQGRADSELAFSWQVGLQGRWLPFGERAGWAVGGGPHLFNAHLAERPLQSLGLGLSAGRYIWESDEDFVLLQLGYSIPFIQGLTQGNDFQTQDDSRVPKDWTFHRFTLSIQYGF